MLNYAKIVKIVFFPSNKNNFFLINKFAQLGDNSILIA